MSGSPRLALPRACLLLLALVTAAAAAEPTRTLVLSIDGKAGTPSVTIVSRDEDRLVLELQIPSLEATPAEIDGRPFQRLAIPDGGCQGAVGQAEVPTYTRLVVLPRGAGARVTVEDVQLAELPAMDLAPCQPVVDGSRGLAAPVVDQAWYAAAEAIEPGASAGEPAIMHSLRVVPVTFQPLRYDPRTGRLAAARAMRVTVDLSGRDPRNDLAGPPRPLPESFARLCADAVVGFVREEVVATGPGTYLMICPNLAPVVAAVQPLADWRRRQGYNVVVATTAQTGTTNTQIRAYLQNAFAALDPPLEFVTLVGDANGAVSLPTWLENISGYGGEGDHDYTMLAGDDILADVHVGRLSVSSVAQLQTVVDKIVDYESDPDLSDPTWFTTAGLTGDPGSSGYSTIWVNQFVKESLLRLGYTRVDTIWGGNFVTQMLATINRGETLFTYRGIMGMSGLESPHIMNTANGRQLPFAIVLTCDTGSFHYNSEARSEAFLRAPNGGGIGAIGTATWGTHTRYNNCMFLGTAHGVLNTGEYRLGPALTRGKLNLYTNYWQNEPNQARIWAHWNNLMGDPATEMWTGAPAVLTVAHPTALSTGANAIPVTVTRQGQPVAGARVAVTQGTTLRVVADTDAAGQAVLSLAGAAAGPLLVTVTGHDLDPYLGTATIGTVVSSLDFAAMQLTDADGNGDGLANPGESLDLTLQLANHGAQALPGVTGALASPVPWAHVNTSALSYGTVPGGGAAWSQGSYAVALDPGAPGGTTLPLRLVATSGQESWTSLVDVAVHGPRAALVQAVFGGPGGTMDPGETGTLRFEVRNDGDVATAGATATLTCNSNWVRVTDASGSFGPLAPGTAGQQSDTFAVSVAGDCYPGHLANFVVALAFAEGGTGVVEFQVVIGTAGPGDPTGPDLYGYYIFDDTDPDPNAPVYDWQDITQVGQETGIHDDSSYGDDTRVFDLPFAFTMYGESFTRVSICSNGWLALGQTYQRLYRNWHLPSDGGPGNMICGFWDDLAQGRVYTYHDVAAHRYVVQWDGFGTETGGGHYQGDETFQIILYDPAYHATTTGDAPIEILYQSVTVVGDESSYFAVGLQNGPRTDGVTYVYGNNYAGGAAALAPGRALRIVPISPQVQGVLRGQVTNASGGGTPIPGAQITVLDAGRRLTSGDDGHYEGNAPIGVWDIAATHPSCAPDTVRNVTINEEGATTVDFSLRDIGGPAFANTTVLPATDDPAGPYVVESTVTDLTGVLARHLYYTTSADGAGPHEIPLTVVDAATGLVRGEIPGQPLGTVVQYWLTAADDLGNVAQDPPGAPWPLYSFQVIASVGAIVDELETGSGWGVNFLQTDTATSGIWTRVDPHQVIDAAQGRVVVPGDDHTPAPGVKCWLTGQDAEGADQGGQDVDGGTTTLYSPAFDLSGYAGAYLSYWRWYTNDTGGGPGDDTWRVQISDDSTNWVDLEATTTSERAWVQRSFDVSSYVDLTNWVRLRFIARDGGAESIVEALVDDLRFDLAPVIVDEAPPTVTLVHPDGGQIFDVDEPVTVAWDAHDDTGVVEARLYFVQGVSEQLIAGGPFDGTYPFVWSEHFPAQPAAGRFRIEVSDVARRTATDTAAGDVSFGVVTPVDEALPAAAALAQNQPNPLNPSTVIRFALPRAQRVALRIYDVQGRLVRTLADGLQTAGVHDVVWTGRDDRGRPVASGPYVYRLEGEGLDLTRRMLLVK